MAVKLGNGNWAVKENKLLAYNDNSGRFFNKEFDFSRGSSATYVGKDGLIKSAASDVPRIDFSDSTNGALLLEPTRSNIFDYSSNLNAWSKLNSTVTESNVLSLDGVNNSYGYERTSSSTSYIYRTVYLSNTTQYTLSFFVKSGTSTNIRTDLWDTAQSVQGSIQINLETKAVSNFIGNSYKIEDYTNGWMRISVTFTSESSFGTTFNRYFNADSVGSELYIWGAQLEVGSYSTSIIPTSGSTTTRLADVCNNSGSAQDFNSEEGVLYAEISALANDGTYRQILLHDNAYNNRIALRYMPTSNEIDVYLNNGTVQAQFNYTLTNALDFNKIAFSFKENDFSLWVNGVEVATDTSGTTFSANTLQKIDFDFTNNYFFYGNIKDLQVFTEAKSDEFLAALTTI